MWAGFLLCSVQFMEAHSCGMVRRWWSPMAADAGKGALQICRTWGSPSM